MNMNGNVVMKRAALAAVLFCLFPFWAKGLFAQVETVDTGEVDELPV